MSNQCLRHGVDAGLVSMTRNDYTAIEHAADHIARALSAAHAADPFSSSAHVALQTVRGQLSAALQLVRLLKAQARVTP